MSDTVEKVKAELHHQRRRTSAIRSYYRAKENDGHCAKVHDLKEEVGFLEERYIRVYLHYNYLQNV
jgi:hypothetical protein